MLTYEYPPKPGEVTLGRQNFFNLLHIAGHTESRETLVAAAGFALAGTLVAQAESPEEANQIISEVAAQANKHLQAYNQEFYPLYIFATHLGFAFEYGLRLGRESQNASGAATN